MGKEDIKTETKELLNIEQACATFQIVGIWKSVAVKKFSKQNITVEEWKSLLIKNRIVFNLK